MTVEVVFWVPWLLLLCLGGVQLVTYGWAYMSARHAADVGVQTARVEGGSAERATAEARAVLAQAGGAAVTDTSVSVTRGADTTTVTITTSPVRVVPLIPLPHIAVTVAAPTEAFRSSADAP